MIECTYCRRIFKKPHHICPGCGAKSFEVKFYKENLIIKNPPNDGYKSCLSGIKKKKNNLLISFIIIMIIALMFILILISPIIATFVSTNYIIVAIIGAICLSIASIFIIKEVIPLIHSAYEENLKIINKEEENLKYLSKNGILIKNLEYVPIECPLTFGRIRYKIKFKYVTKEGREITETTYKEYKKSDIEKDNTIDLLIDPKDPYNYFIDFEIY